jgi:site-specific DNA recombinase
MELTAKPEDQIFKDIKSGKYRHCYLVYIRKSTDEPDNQKNSITYQKAEGIKFADREKLSVAPVTLAGFCVDGVISEKHSGFKEDNDLTFTKDGLVQYHIDRPKFQKLVQFLSLGLFKGIVCLCWDRMSRNKGDDTIIRKLMRKGVDVRFVYANYDKTSSGALHMDIDGMFAEHHSRVTSEKVRLTHWSLRERGVVAYKAPIGYLNQGTMEHKPFDPERAPIIKKLFEYYVTGDWSLADLVRLANQQGLTTAPSRRRRTTDEMLAEEGDEVKIEKVSRPMTISNIQKILTNPFYTGRTFGNENNYVRSVSHEALIPDDLFNRVQTMLKKKNVSLHLQLLPVRCHHLDHTLINIAGKINLVLSLCCFRAALRQQINFLLGFRPLAVVQIIQPRCQLAVLMFLGNNRPIRGLFVSRPFPNAIIGSASDNGISCWLREASLIRASVVGFGGSRLRPYQG